MSATHCACKLTVGGFRKEKAAVYLTSARYPAPPCDMAAEGLLPPPGENVGCISQAVVLMPAWGRKRRIVADQWLCTLQIPSSSL